MLTQTNACILLQKLDYLLLLLVEPSSFTDGPPAILGVRFEALMVDPRLQLHYGVI